MRGLSVTTLLLLLGLSTLAGQTHQNGDAKQPPHSEMPQSDMPQLNVVRGISNCPVELTAEQSHDGALSAAGKPAHAEQVIDLSIRNSRLPRIVGAEIEVHGTLPRGRVVALEGAGGGRAVADAVRTVHVEGSVPANQERTHRLTVRQLTSVAWIDLIEVRYADGSTWHRGDDQSCRVAPDPVVRVASEVDPR